jgi:hypothetical protein
MFAMRDRVFWHALSLFKDQPNVHYLEMGVYGVENTVVDAGAYYDSSFEPPHWY